MDTISDNSENYQSRHTAALEQPSPDFAVARRFLTLLGEGEDFTFQTLDDTPARKASLAHIFHTSGGEVSDDLLQRLAVLNQQGAGVFVTVNRTDGQGRKTENITGIRATFLDLDGAPLSVIDTAPLPPHIVVESSPGRYHIYWIVAGLPLDQFPAVQAALANRFGGDPTVKDLPRVMRLPGFYHRKRDPFLTHIIREEGGQPYAAAEFLKAFAIQPAQLHSSPTRTLTETSRKIAKGSRNSHLASLAGTMRHRGMSPSAIAAALQEENHVNCDPPLSGDEVASITQSICRYAPDAPGPNETFDPESIKQLDLQTTVQRLAALAPLVYEQHRVPVAKQLGVRPPVLDKEVEKRRAQKTNSAALQGVAIQFPEVEPWPEPVAAAQLLNDLKAMIGRLVVADENGLRAAALWVLATYFLESTDCAPILAITSPEKRCGKSTLLTILSKLVARPLVAASITPATAFRVIEKYKPTLLIDEADTFLRENEELKGILNSGHTRSTAFVVRSVGEDHEPRQFSTFSFKAIACIGTLPATLVDRSIEIRLRRKHQSDPIEKTREIFIAEWQALCRRCARFAQDNAESFSNLRPVIPGELNDRTADSWTPLLALADLAGGNWPSHAREAALTLSKESDDETMNTRLLADIRAIFVEKGAAELFTDELLDSLYGIQESGWDAYSRGKPLTARQLANKLKAYVITSAKLRQPGATPGKRGYRKADFEDAWSRYLPPIGSATTPQASIGAGSRQESSATHDDSVADEISIRPSNGTACGAVADNSPARTG